MLRKKGILGQILVAVCEALIGILLLIDPNGLTMRIIQVLGIVFALVGLFQVIKYIRTPAQEAAKGQFLTKGLLALLAGIFCIVRAEWFINTFPMLAILYGIGTLVLGVSKVEATFDLVRAKNRRWVASGIGAFLTVACGAVIVFDPFTATDVLWIFAGVSLLAEAAIDVLALFFSGKRTPPSAAPQPEA